MDVIYRLLDTDGHNVTLFEKSRGVGGRCSTRYINDKLIDHGTPYFHSTNNEFIEFCGSKVEENILVKKEKYYYPTNGINKLCSSMIHEDDLIKNTKIKSCEFINEKWTLIDENNIIYKNFDKLILTIPAPQILQMDIKLIDKIVDKLECVKYNSIATLLLYSYTLANIMNPILINNKNFKKIVNNSSKYSYDNFSSYVIHLSEELTNGQNFQSKDEVLEFVKKRVYIDTGINLEDDFHIQPHFWKYAFVSKSINDDFIYDKKNCIGICGDYFNGEDLEGSYMSSKRLYEHEFK